MMEQTLVKGYFKVCERSKMYINKIYIYTMRMMRMSLRNGNDYNRDIGNTEVGRDGVEIQACMVWGKCHENQYYLQGRHENQDIDSMPA